MSKYQNQVNINKKQDLNSTNVRFQRKKNFNQKDIEFVPISGKKGENVLKRKEGGIQFYLKNL